MVIVHSSRDHSKILTIPPELLVHVLSYLDWGQLLTVDSVSRLHFRKLLSCSPREQVCRIFHNLISSSLELRYIIELGADQLVHNPHFSASGLRTIQDRLNLLLDRRRRWRTLDWTQQVPVTLPGSCQAYELVGGVFAKTMNGGGLEDLRSQGSRHFMEVWLPTRESRVATGKNTDEIRRFVKNDLGMWTRDFAIDPTQDLAAFLEVDERYDAYTFPMWIIVTHVFSLGPGLRYTYAPRAQWSFTPLP
jgi:hypothetical protein